VYLRRAGIAETAAHPIRFDGAEARGITKAGLASVVKNRWRGGQFHNGTVSTALEATATISLAFPAEENLFIEDRKKSVTLIRSESIEAVPV